MGKIVDFTGVKFNRLTAIYYDKTYKTKTGRRVGAWWCKCDCGNPELIPVVAGNLKNGITKSCGCYKREVTILQNLKSKKKYNTYDLSKDYGIGYTSKGEEFYFDLEDYDKIKDYCWRIHNKGYVACSVKLENKTSKTDVLMHILVMDGYDENLNIINKNIEVDHINGRKSRNDNRKNNLRQCSHQENLYNYPISSNNKSGVTGVYYDKRYHVWKSFVSYKGQRMHLGSFYEFEEAIKARLKAEKEYYGEYSPQKHLYKQYGIK